MRFLSTSHWDYSDELDGLLHFAQRINEALFDYTFDKFKIPAMYTLTLCREAIMLIDIIRDKKISGNNITYVLEELDEQLRNDKAAKSLIKIDYKNYLTDTNDQNLKQKRNGIELILLKLQNKKYFDKIKEQLKHAIQNCAKGDIDALAIQYILCLRNFGYTNEYLHRKAKNFFFYRKTGKISSVDEIDSFFEIFNLSSKSYDVIFKAVNIIPEYEKVCNAFGVEILNDYEPFSSRPQEKSFITSVGDNEVFIKTNIKKELDPYGAKKDAEQRLHDLSNIISLYRHKSKIGISEDSIVCEVGTKDAKVIPARISPIEKCLDKKPEKAYVEALKLYKEFSFYIEDLQKFLRVIKLHGATISTASQENQLLNLWTALETLTPSLTGKVSNISKIIETLIPFQKIRYTRYIVENLHNSLFRWRARTVTSVLNRMDLPDNTNSIEKVAALLSINEFEEHRQYLYEKLDQFSLMRFRFFSLSNQFRSSKKILNFIQDHERRIRWQLRRIYRTRNLLVHTGQTTPNLDVLVENTHTYLDIFLKLVIELVVERRHAHSMEHAITEVALLNQEYENRLSSNNIYCDITNYKKLLFGI